MWVFPIRPLTAPRQHNLTAVNKITNLFTVGPRWATPGIG